MKKVIISVLGQDRPGIIAAVSGILFKSDCNIENVSQTILQSEFSGIFIISVPESLDIEVLGRELKAGLDPMGLYAYVKPVSQTEPPADFTESEPFVITTRSPDHKRLVANITKVIARHGVNVSNLQAVFKGGDDPDRNIMIYEVDIPKNTNSQALYAELRDTAASLQSGYQYSTSEHFRGYQSDLIRGGFQIIDFQKMNFARQQV